MIGAGHRPLDDLAVDQLDALFGGPQQVVDRTELFRFQGVDLRETAYLIGKPAGLARANRQFL